MNGIWIYLAIGTVWCCIVDMVMTPMNDNWKRFRFIVFWPITFLSFCIGIFIGWYKDRGI